MIDMALLFSVVRVTANDCDEEFLVGGIPREFEDLEGWTAFDNFMEDISEETEVGVHVESYLYGEGETNVAAPEEIAYFMKRINQCADFLSLHCDNIEDSDFTFPWSGEEQFDLNMEVNSTHLQ